MVKILSAVSAAALIGMMSVASPALAGPQGNAVRRIGLTAVAQVRHDSNVAHASAARAAARGISQSDQRFSPNMKVDIGLPFGAQNFSLSGGIGYDFYRRNTRLNRERIQLNSALAMHFARCNPSLNSMVNRRQSDLADSGATAGVGVGTVRNTEMQWSVGGTLSCGKSFGLRPTVGYTYQKENNSALQRKITDKNISTYMVGMGYVHPSIGDIQLFAQQRDTRYDNQILANGEENGTRQRSYGVSFSRNIGSRFQGAVSVSLSDVKSRQAGVAGFNGLNWSADLTAKATPRLQVHAVVDRSISSALAIASNYNVSTNYALDATYAVSPLISVQAGYSTTKRDFQGSFGVFSPGVTGQNLLSTDRKNILFGSINYNFSPKLKFILDGGHETRNANGSFYDYKNNRVALRAELSL